MKGEDIKQKVKQSGKTFAEVARLMGVRPQTLTIIFASDDVKTGSLE
jgi:transposase-like protein